LKRRRIKKKSVDICWKLEETKSNPIMPFEGKWRDERREKSKKKKGRN
jgi:hypothetical protein